MKKRNIYLGDTPLNRDGAEVEGTFVRINGEKFYKISNYNRMPDFFMTIVSDSDHWMFISSNGSLTAGRKDRNNALFPYYSDDKIHDYKDITGSKSVLLVEKEGRTYLWEPFTEGAEQIYSIERNIYKSIYGNKILFEEHNLKLGIKFSYSWSNSEKFGFVRTTQVMNTGVDELKLELVDGIQNILPYGVDYNFQNEYSNLLDGYKKSEQMAESGLGLFMLSSIPVDRAEPSESLRSTSVWSCGTTDSCEILLSTKQLGAFKTGKGVHAEFDVRASRGAYFVHQEIALKAGEVERWYMVAEINQDASEVMDLNSFILSENDLEKQLISDIALGTEHLKKIVAGADGLQLSNEELGSARHFSNTMFNVMRGGIFTNNYTIDTADFTLFVAQTNAKQAKAYSTFLSNLSAQIDYNELQQKVEALNDADLSRICFEYLPLTFSRRHGDPSRPWNLFSIETKNEDGSPKLNYQGNWRDIFQNWEALSLSYPEFVEGIISKFVNATTADGYNPYRISRAGIDWECPDPSDPWAYIGYWGDHQIIYLQKLLELSKAHHPEKFEKLLNENMFAYANVPYRIKSYAEIVKNPQDTIEFDTDLNAHIKRLEKELGADARLLLDDKGEVVKANLVEKIMVTLLSKLSNFIPEAGIWLNTQRPEWNDANNALVGSGVSMVTLYYIRRFVKFWEGAFSEITLQQVAISKELHGLFMQMKALFGENTALIEKGFSNADRKYFTDRLGKAGEEYRSEIYMEGFSGIKEDVSREEILKFLNLTLSYIDQSIRANEREDGLYHAYNLMSYDEDGVSIRYLYEMLEGQVAVLSSGYLSVEESLNVLDALKTSKLFREDQYSYILYPNRELARFVDKNNIPEVHITNSKLLKQLIADGDKSVVIQDHQGQVHFNGSVRNADVLEDQLNKLDKEHYGALLGNEKQQVLDVYEAVFDHQSFTGRSGTFYAYEGLGSIYWHMVSKLLLASQEIFKQAVKEGASEDVIGRLKQHYYEIKAGIGLFKSPELYGAFPTDAYSHTPGSAGAKQPGMTGQVKEDVITRFGELGLAVKGGKIHFDTHLLNPEELVSEKTVFIYFDLSGKEKDLQLEKNQLAFTYCQVPVVYTLNDENMVCISINTGEKICTKGNEISSEVSSKIFQRTGEVEKIEVNIKK